MTSSFNEFPSPARGGGSERGRSSTRSEATLIEKGTEYRQGARRRDSPPPSSLRGAQRRGNPVPSMRSAATLDKKGNACPLPAAKKTASLRSAGLAPRSRTLSPLRGARGIRWAWGILWSDSSLRGAQRRGNPCGGSRRAYWNGFQGGSDRAGGHGMAYDWRNGQPGAGMNRHKNLFRILPDTFRHQRAAMLRASNPTTRRCSRLNSTPIR
jgi:hypothetical protein